MEIQPFTGLPAQRPSPSAKTDGIIAAGDSIVIGSGREHPLFSHDAISKIMKPQEDPYTSDDAHWNPEVEKRIDAFIDRVRAGEIENPVAVFDADGTIWRDDIGEQFLKWLIKNRKLKDVDYSKDIYGEYEKLLEKDVGAAYAMSTTIMKGINEKELTGWCQDFFPDYFRQNVFPKQKELIKRLQEAGVDVWIVTASNRWIVQGASPHMGVSADHVVGIQTEVNNGTLTDRIIPPITYRQGKVDAIGKYIGKKVDFAAGNSMTDYEMLGSAKELSLVINPRDSGAPEENLMELAKKSDWAIQKWL